MGRFHHSKKAHSEGRKKKNNKFAAGKTGNKKLDEDFVYTQKHKNNIWNSFCNFLDEKFAEEDLSEILDAEEISRFKIPPAIPALLEFIPTNVGDLESDEERRSRIRAQTLADKSYARSSLSGWIKEIEAEIQQGNGSRVETCRCADQPGSSPISEI